MFKPLVASLVIASGLLDANDVAPALLLKEESMIIEYTASAGEAVVILEAEIEDGLLGIEVRSPIGAPLMRMRAGQGTGMDLQGFVLETRESEPAELIANFAEGVYDIRAQTWDGRRAVGSATLSHRLLPAPVVLYPTDGATHVPSSGLVVTWVNDPNAIGYEVVLEQDENDGLTVRMPGGSNSLQVPDGVLAPGKRAQLEIAAIERCGNRTLVEVVFSTL